VAVLVVVVRIAPMRFAVSIAVDPITMIPRVGSVIALDHTARQAHERNGRTRNEFPVQSLHEAPHLMTRDGGLQSREGVAVLSS